MAKEKMINPSMFVLRLVIGSIVLSLIILFIGIFLLNIHKFLQKRLEV